MKWSPLSISRSTRHGFVKARTFTWTTVLPSESVSNPRQATYTFRSVPAEPHTVGRAPTPVSAMVSQTLPPTYVATEKPPGPRFWSATRPGMDTNSANSPAPPWGAPTGVLSVARAAAQSTGIPASALVVGPAARLALLRQHVGVQRLSDLDPSRGVWVTSEGGTRWRSTRTLPQRSCRSPP